MYILLFNVVIFWPTYDTDCMLYAHFFFVVICCLCLCVCIAFLWTCRLARLVSLFALLVCVCVCVKLSPHILLHFSLTHTYPSSLTPSYARIFMYLCSLLRSAQLFPFFTPPLVFCVCVCAFLSSLPPSPSTYFLPILARLTISHQQYVWLGSKAWLRCSSV
jgi:hypothetical protein